MTSPADKFALAQAAVLDAVIAIAIDEMPVYMRSTVAKLQAQRDALAAADAEFKATGGAE